MIYSAMGWRRNRKLVECATLALGIFIAFAGAVNAFAASTAAAGVAATATPAIVAAPSQAPAPTSSATPSATPTVTATQQPTAASNQSVHPLAPAINPKVTPGVIALLQTTDGSERNPDNWVVRVYKSHHQLVVFYKGRLYRSYRAVFGRNLDTSAKVFAGDRRTPEGSYFIISKHPSRRWRYFLKLNYPNMIDLSHFEELRAAREIPAAVGHEADAGGAIGIHGTDVPVLNEGNVNWTTGCISVDNGAIDELEALLPVGTLVVIKP
jgi:lipoprotein-anchoring transpeptidase ErfK/SrfK